MCLSNIYVLIDPITLEVKYVGKTNNPKERLRAHISPHIYMRTNNKKCIWTEKVKSMGLRPVMTVLAKVSQEEEIFWEYFYWKLFKDSCNLLNSAVIMKEVNQYQIKF